MEQTQNSRFEGLCQETTLGERLLKDRRNFPGEVFRVKQDKFKEKSLEFVCILWTFYEESSFLG